MSFIGKKHRVVSATEARSRLSEILSTAAGGHAVVIRRRGGSDAVVIGADEYRRLSDPIIAALERSGRMAKQAGLDRMTMTEINAEVAAERRRRGRGSGRS